MATNLKVLMIGSDRKLFEEGSAVSERMKEYGSLVGELHIVNMCDSSEGFKDKQLAPNVWVYPTNSAISLLRPLDAARMGKRLVYEKKFVRGKSLITCQDMESGWAGMRVKKKWRIPLELQVHTDVFSPYFGGFQNSVRKWFAPSIIRTADTIRVVNNSLRSIILQVKPDADVSVLPIYVEREKIEGRRLTFDLHARYPWRFIILTVSRLAPEKNLTHALEAMALVKHGYPGAGLLIVGSGPEEARLRAYAKKLGLAGSVEFAGWQTDLASYYLSANMFLQTSLFEGYGLSLVEAGLYGLPVVTTPVGLASELQHGKEAYIYPVGHPELFAQGIVDLIENLQKRENLRMNLKKTLEEKLLTREQYLMKVQSNWEETAKKIL